MKTTTSWTAILLSLAILFLLPACKKDNKEELLGVSDDEAAEVIASGLASSSGGLTSQVEDAVRLASDSTPALKSSASIAYDSTFTYTNPAGSAIAFSYTVHYEYGWTGLINPVFFLDYDMNGYMDSPRLSVTGENSGNFSVTNLYGATTEFTVTGACEQSGSATSKIFNKSSFTTACTYVITDLKVDKYTYVINSGSMTVTFTGKVSGGAVYTFTGTLEFLGNQQVKLTLSGKNYYINIETGEVG